MRVFEVDSPQTEMVERETLQKVGIDSSAVTFVAADFEKDDWRLTGETRVLGRPLHRLERLRRRRRDALAA